MKMMNKFCALMLSVALCAGMAAPAFAYGGEPVEEVEQPVLTSTTDEEDVVTVTDEETGALTPEGNLTMVDDYQTKVAIAAGVGLVAAKQNITEADCDSFMYAVDPEMGMPGGFAVNGGVYTLSDKPGLGIDIDF